MLSLLFPYAVAVLPARDGTEPIPATETELLNALEGETRTVRGIIDSASTNVTGVHFLRFRDSSFVGIIFPRFLPNFPGGTPSRRYSGKVVAVTGELELYRGARQIQLRHPDQIEILEDAPPPPAPKAEPETEAEASSTAPAEEANASQAAPPDNAEPAGEETEEAQEEPDLEVVNGVPAIDWRLYFPE